MDGGGPKYDRPTAAPVEAGAGNRLHPGPGLNRAVPPKPCSELKPGEVAATDVVAGVVAGVVATGRCALLCTASISGDTGGLAATVFCANAVDGTRPLIIVALAKMSSLLEENKRDRKADTHEILESLSNSLERLHDEYVERNLCT